MLTDYLETFSKNASSNGGGILIDIWPSSFIYMNCFCGSFSAGLYIRVWIIVHI